MIQINKYSGFTLIEVLVAMVVLAVGLLGLAGLQGTTLKNNQSAYNRSQATQLAYDIVDRIRANMGGEAIYSTGTATAKPNCLSTTGCSEVDMAENDLFEWHAAITATLPEGVGSIALAGGIYTVTINWNDNRIEAFDPDADGPNFAVSFQL